MSVTRTAVHAQAITGGHRIVISDYGLGTIFYRHNVSKRFIANQVIGKMTELEMEQLCLDSRAVYTRLSWRSSCAS